MDRRAVLTSLGAVAFASPSRAQETPHWSSPVIDMHFHIRRTPELSLRKRRELTAIRHQGPAPGRSTPVFEGDGGDQRKPAEQPVNRVSLAKPAVIEYSIARQDSYNLRRRRRICHSISHPVSTQKKFHPR